MKPTHLVTVKQGQDAHPCVRWGKLVVILQGIEYGFLQTGCFILRKRCFKLEKV